MIEQELNKVIELALQSLYQDDKTNLQFQKTRKEFEGDVTLVVFPLTRVSKKSPEQTAEDIGQYLQEEVKKEICVQEHGNVVPTNRF